MKNNEPEEFSEEEKAWCAAVNGLISILEGCAPVDGIDTAEDFLRKCRKG